MCWELPILIPQHGLEKFLRLAFMISIPPGCVILSIQNQNQGGERGKNWRHIKL